MDFQNISAKFHPNPIWNDGTFGFFEEVVPNNMKKEQQQQDE